MAALNDACDNVSKRLEHLERKKTVELNNAMKFSKAGKKREALQCIKKKKMYEDQLDKLTNTLNSLEAQKIVFESMGMNKEILAAQRAAADAMQAQTKEMGGVEGVEDTYENMREAMDDANDIQEVMGGNLEVPGMADDDELEAELEGLLEADLADDLSQVNISGQPGSSAATGLPEAPISLPSPGTTKVMTDEERELEELQASMAM